MAEADPVTGAVHLAVAPRNAVVDGVIYFSKPSDFNDPWDF
jgi:hypothetical protein